MMSERDRQKRAEAVLRGYQADKKLLRDLTFDAIFGRSPSGTPVSGGVISNPVLRAVLALDSKEANAASHRIAAIEDLFLALSRLSNGDKRQRLLQEHFWCGKTVLSIADEMGVSYSVARRWKKTACLMLADRLEGR